MSAKVEGRNSSTQGKEEAKASEIALGTIREIQYRLLEGLGYLSQNIERLNRSTTLLNLILIFLTAVIALLTFATVADKLGSVLPPTLVVGMYFSLVGIMIWSFLWVLRES
jgi:Mg2+ and Co2+ transporter CorA